jgi:DNA-directed RNA polymerase specialized sigma24 family protein
MRNEYVDYALASWAKWGRSGESLGWPPVTVLAKVAQQGFTGAAQRGPTPEMGTQIEAVESAVLRLKPIERKVVVKHYIHWEPIEVSARRCHMSPNRFRTVLNRARNLVAEWIPQPFEASRRVTRTMVNGR